VPAISDLIQRKSDGTYEHVQNVSDDASIASADIIQVYSSAVNLDWAVFQLPTSFALTPSSTYANVTIEGYQYLSNAVTYNDYSTSIGKYCVYDGANKRMAIGFTKGTTLANMRIALTDVVYRYQLATPVSTDIETSGLLTTEPSGTIYRQPAIAEAGIYASGLTILDSTYPIDSLESIYKVDFSTGLKTSMAVADAVIATDGLSFTHPSLANGDLVFFTYLYDDAFPVGESTITHYDSRYAVTDSGTGKVYKIGFAVTDGVISLTKTEV
jgi:hypothetical protein